MKATVETPTPQRTMLSPTTHIMASQGKAGILRTQRLNSYNLLVILCLCIGSLAFGYATAIIGTTLGQPSFLEYFELTSRSNGAALISTINGVYQTGGFIGTITQPWIIDKYGRKWACAVAAILLVISGVIMTSSVDIGMFTAFRFVAGWGAWMLYAVIPILLNEIVPAHLRGALVDLHAVFLVFGYALSGWVGYGFYFWKSGGLKTWRPPMAISILFPVVLLALLPFLPESPRWLCMKGRVEEAEAILVRLHASPNDPNHDAAKAEFYQIKKQIEIDRTLGNSWMHIVKKPSYRKRALLCLGVAGFTQCCGILVISNYGPSIYSRLGYPPQTQLMLAALWMTVGWLCTIGAIFLVDRFSRPKYIAVGLFGCMACLIVEAALVANFVPSDNISALRAAIAMFFIFVFFYCGFIDGTQFSYMGEMFPTHLRAKGLCLGVSTISLMNIVWLQSAPTAFITIGWKFYLALIIPGTIGALIIWLYFPDTNGLPLEEVAAIFGDTDEIALYQRDLVVAESHTVVEMMHDQPRTKEVGA